MNVNIQNQNPLLTKLTTSTNVSSSTTSSTTTNAPRYALSINNNVANINNALLRNVQLSPKSKISLTQSNTQQTNLFNTISNIQNYSINLQSQLNYASLNMQKNQSQQQQQQQQTNSSLLTAASVLATNNLTSQMYQPSMQQASTCSLNNTLFVGNLHASLQEIDLIQVFRPFGRIVECCKKWLHFGFVKFTTEEEACHAYVTLNGFRLKGRPMRLEFQNRTKKARIKAILAQAALQAANGTPCNPDLLSMGNVNIAGSSVNNIQLGYSNFIDDRQQLYYQNPPKKVETKESSFFNSDQLMKFASNGSNEELNKDKQFEMNFDLAESNNYYDLNNIDLASFSTSVFESKLDDEKRSQNDDFLLGLLKRHPSPSDSPTHEALSLSSDSGCRSNSFLNDEDSVITSIQSSVRTVTKSKSFKNKKLEEVTISEHLEFTCSKSSPIKEEKEEFSKHVDDEIDDESDDDNDDDCSSDCDTSDDASDIPSEADGDSDCLNDLDLLDENFLNGTTDYECEDVEAKYFIQVMEKDGSIARKKLDYGIYKSVNSTFSLFIEPHDILKQVETDEFTEYNLFPSNECVDQPLHDTLMLFKNLCCV
ncbi:unnamed protein product [Brachionus calyciflorus]|uniref:RRM domain-containing protein n=1 Tax=Brachionus calyciflorus TaxID=104777 RepID=A0A813ME04_9BILA|nr:unnamed protein product [Brachionus calyciflorus]